MTQRDDKPQALSKTQRKAYLAAADLVPMNWCDPLLTGPDAALSKSGPWNCPDIESLLRGVKKRIEEAANGR